MSAVAPNEQTVVLEAGVVVVVAGVTSYHGYLL